MRAHLVQLDIAWENKNANQARVSSLLEKAAPSPGDFVLLPEMFDTGFSFDLSKTADTDGSTLRFCESLAKRFQITLQGSLTAMAPDGRGLNRAVAIGPRGELLASYDKVHPFSIGMESEKFSGGRNVATYSWHSAGSASIKVAPAICYDLRFPELFRVAQSNGAELFAIGANWPSARVAHWRALLIARAIENQAFVLGVNRVGRDPALEYPGGSMIIDPQGQVLAEADRREQVLTAEIDPGVLRRWREKFPALKDRLPLAVWANLAKG